MRRSIAVGFVAAFTAAASISMTGTAGAAPFAQGEFHDEFSFVDPDFCGAGLAVQIDVVVDGRFQGVRQGSDGLVHFMDHTHVSDLYTNLANGKTVSDSANTMTRDLKVVDNGDGTLTITDLSTGNATLYSADGKVIARNPGQVRFQFLVDHAGTPADPSDDVFLEDFGLIKGSTGRSDDFCAAAVPALS